MLKIVLKGYFNRYLKLCLHLWLTKNVN